jgi:hypothetical protein
MYGEKKLQRPEYRRIGISLERFSRILFMIENSWRLTSRHHSQKELENVLTRQHEIEKETEGIEDVFLREYIYEQLDNMAATRRSLSEDIKWDIESVKKNKGIP